MLIFFFCLFISAGKYYPSQIETNTIVFWQVYLPLDFLLSETSCVLRSYQHALKYHFNQYFSLTLLTKFLRYKGRKRDVHLFTTAVFVVWIDMKCDRQTILCDIHSLHEITLGFAKLTCFSSQNISCQEYPSTSL